MPQNRIIKLKRTTGSDLPSELSPGELVYLEGKKQLVIGKEGNQTSLVLDGSIVEAQVSGQPKSINLKKTNDDGAPVLTINAPDMTDDYQLTLPSQNPTTPDVPLLVDTDGTMAYDQPAAGDLADIGDVGVEGDALNDKEILIYDASGDTPVWKHSPPTIIKEMMGLDTNADVHYRDVTVNNNLEVDGDSGALNPEVITVMDKMVSLGISPNLVTVSATINNGQVFLGDIPIENTPAQAFVDSEFAEVPTGIYSVYQTAESQSGQKAYYTDDDNVEWVVNTFSFRENNAGRALLAGVDETQPITDTFEINGQITADILVVGSSSGNPQNGNGDASDGGTFAYFKNVTMPAGTYTIQVGNGSLGGYTNAQTTGSPGTTSFITLNNEEEFAHISAQGSGGTSMGNDNLRRPGDGDRSMAMASGYQQGGHYYVGKAGHGWTEGDIVENDSGEVVLKELVEDSFASDSSYNPDIHITRADAKFGVLHGKTGSGGYQNHPYEMTNHPYYEEGKGPPHTNWDVGRVDDNTAVGVNVQVTGVKFEIDGLGGSYSGGGRGWSSSVQDGVRGVGAKGDTNHRGGGGVDNAWTNNDRGGHGIVIVRYRKPGSAGGSEDGKAFNVPDSTYTYEDSDENLLTFNVSVSDTLSTDTTADGGGIMIPGSETTGAPSIKRLQWVNENDGAWEFSGGDLEIASSDGEDSAIYVDGQKVIEVGMKKIVGADAGDGEILFSDAINLHNYTDEQIDDEIKVAKIDESFTLKGATLKGDLDFGDF